MSNINDPVLYMKASELSYRVRIHIVQHRIKHLEENHLGISFHAEGMIKTWNKLLRGLTNEWNSIYTIMLKCDIETLWISNEICDQVEMKDSSLFHGSDKFVDMIYIGSLQENFDSLLDFVC
tara:strand:+ start:9619 stop:9984 length:366 start_codon:yes stop_codon:yes gene_type:complete